MLLLAGGCAARSRPMLCEVFDVERHEGREGHEYHGFDKRAYTTIKEALGCTKAGQYGLHPFVEAGCCKRAGIWLEVLEGRRPLVWRPCTEGSQGGKKGTAPRQ